MELETLNSTEAEPQSGEQAEVVAPQEEQEQEPSRANADFEMVDVGEDDGAEDAPEPDGAGPATGEKNAQTREENAAIRAARLRAQREAEAATMARISAKTDAEIAGSGVLNPYTQQPFRSLAEFREYGEKVKRTQLARKAKQSGKSVEELTEDEANRAFLTELRQTAERQEREARQAQTQIRAQQDFIQTDVADFLQKHPEMGKEGILALESNQQFRAFCGSRYGREPLAALYDDFRKLMGDAGSAAVLKNNSHRARTTGGGSGGNTVLTPSQKAALDAWNEEHPEMRMTAKEFLGR